MAGSPATEINAADRHKTVIRINGPRLLIFEPLLQKIRDRVNRYARARFRLEKTRGSAGWGLRPQTPIL